MPEPTRPFSDVFRSAGRRRPLLLPGLLALLALVTGCQLLKTPLPTPVAAAPSVTPTVSPLPGGSRGPTATVPSTYTPRPGATIVSPTPAGLPSMTPVPSNTPFPTFTTTPTPSSTPTETPTPTVTRFETATPISPVDLTPAPGSANLLPNPSFEEGWYHINRIPELQVPNQWILEWDEGPNPLDPDPWNRFVRPESRVLSTDFLPPNEHNLFIWEGRQTLKIFKGQGALSFRLLTARRLEPGTYIFEINVFPDMVDGYTQGGSKIWAPDPLSGEVRFFVDGPAGNWILPAFGQKNTLKFAFAVDEARRVQIGVHFRGRWAIENNGWFMDDWSLRQAA